MLKIKTAITNIRSNGPLRQYETECQRTHTPSSVQPLSASGSRLWPGAPQGSANCGCHGNTNTISCTWAHCTAYIPTHIRTRIRTYAHTNYLRLTSTVDFTVRLSRMANSVKPYIHLDNRDSVSFDQAYTVRRQCYACK